MTEVGVRPAERLPALRRSLAGLSGVGAALRIPAYRWWFVSQILSASGGMTQAVAQSWLLYQLTGQAVYLGLLTAALFAPVLLLGAFAGALVDRSDRRVVLLCTQTLFLCIGASLALLSAAGAIQVWMLFAAAILTGLVMSVDGPARQVYVLELVGTDRTASAVGLYEVVINASRVLGPAVGGTLLATVGVTACFAVNAVSFLPPIAVLLRYRPAEHLRLRREATRRGAVRAGLRYAAHTPPIRACLLMAAAAGMLFNLGVSLPLLTHTVFHAGGGAYGALMAAFGVGAVVGALFAAAGGPWPAGRRVRLLALATAAAVVLTALSPGLLAAFPAMALAGFFSIWFVALANTLVQLRADEGMRGRVMGVWTMALPGMNPVTGVIAGVVAQTAGARAGFALAGVALAGTAAAGWRALADGHW